jgi:hypothetical protein
MKYEIERMATGETTFKKVAEQMGTGSAFATQSYQFIDTLYGLPAGTVTYRIRQIIDTASTSFTADYIDTVTVEANALCVLNNLSSLLNLLKEKATSSVTIANCTATLNWTSSDLAAMKYEIERKTPLENRFRKIAEQAGTGAAFTAHAYQFVDDLKGISPGIISYRIRQIVDTSNASFTGDYIDTTSIDLIPSCALTEIISLIPNPASQQFILQTTIEKAIPELVIRIVNMNGQLVATIKRTKPQGIANFTIEIPALSRGQYFVSVYDRNELLATKELMKL